MALSLSLSSTAALPPIQTITFIPTTFTTSIIPDSPSPFSSSFSSVSDNLPSSSSFFISNEEHPPTPAPSSSLTPETTCDAACQQTQQEEEQEENDREYDEKEWGRGRGREGVEELEEERGEEMGLRGEEGNVGGGSAAYGEGGKEGGGRRRRGGDKMGMMWLVLRFWLREREREEDVKQQSHFGGVVNALPCYSQESKFRQFPRELPYYFPTSTSTSSSRAELDLDKVFPEYYKAQTGGYQSILPGRWSSDLAIPS
ncbi:hypothetical protein B0T20DRAFT_389680 [Sordaria brevicollis]|uniref:Uncharacterized protein n=1 Tax=Sordaria brevicollis TaxID=83679 RepID=A0AAE0PKW3_SORBR|nr:hypothetical protein B0T20DRAFT_389680 [Sordaria brevicollis]